MDCKPFNLNLDNNFSSSTQQQQQQQQQAPGTNNINNKIIINLANPPPQPQQQQQTIIMDSNCLQPMLEVEIDSSSSPPSTSSTLSSSIPSSLLSLGSQDKLHSQDNTPSKKSVLFDTVTVYHFTRSQGFSSIPSQGGSTLGMKRRHFLRRKLSVDMFEEVRRRSRREILLKIKLDKHRVKAMSSSSSNSNQTRTSNANIDVDDIDININDNNINIDNNNKNVINANNPNENNNFNSDNNNTSNNDNNEEQQMHIKPVLSTTTSSTSTNNSNSNSEDDESFSDYSDISDSELESDSYVFLQPIGVKLRRSLLRASGVGKIDPIEKLECKIIRESRDRSGCKCVNQCIPGLCECTVLGVNCHVDRVSFPCGCVKAGCRNPLGRTQFDVDRVKGHLFDTLYKFGED